ncbi:hypothetical protein GGR50DRAFT_259964 [Xylaria sp. CBS 124048]|nr:hypothetical protein GGR50DRAFT_259964 [Xylaria sp. CBS 124048]
MVARTPCLHALRKGLFSRLHQPLPLNQRDSQQLLQMITASFRKNLDREHPWETDETSTNTPLNPPTHTENHRPTDQHLRAILSNPLFAHPRNADANTPSIPTTHTSPFDVFDSAVSKGLMTPRRAAGFLVAIRSRLLAEHPEDLRQRMSVSGAGLHVLQWLRASGQESNLSFLSNVALVKILIPFLFAEGLQEVAWTWLGQLARASESAFEAISGEPQAQRLTRLITAIIKERETFSQDPMSLDESFAALAKASGMLPPQNPAATAAVRNVWASLSWASTVDASEHPKPSVKSFEEFVEMGRPLGLPLDLAHLDLYHPATPTHLAAIEYLSPRQQILDEVPNMKPRAQKRVLCLILDAAERLQRTGQVAEAPWIERLQATVFERLNLGIFNIRSSLKSSGPIGKGLRVSGL